MEQTTTNTIENFHGVYLLYCKNPKFEGRTYIGYTVDPNRRIKQHNKGKHAGGAWKTSNRGPWVMVMIVHGFPNDVAALRFEWAWQHPKISRRLKHVQKKKAKEKVFQFHLRVLSEMLRVGPWNRLPLTIRWLSEEYAQDFNNFQPPPLHMPICHGTVITKKQKSHQAALSVKLTHDCFICKQTIDGKPMTCLNSDCDLSGHVVCLGRFYAEKGEFVPVEGKCPVCGESFLWGELVRKFKGWGNICCKIETNVTHDFSDSDTD